MTTNRTWEDVTFTVIDHYVLRVEESPVNHQTYQICGKDTDIDLFRDKRRKDSQTPVVVLYTSKVFVSKVRRHMSVTTTYQGKDVSKTDIGHV